MAHLSLDLQPEEHPAKTKYKFDMVRAKIGQLSTIQDMINSFELKLKLIETHDEAASSSRAYEFLQKCQNMRAQVADLERHLQMSEHGPWRKEEAVKQLRSSAQGNLVELQLRICDAQMFWNKIVIKRKEETQAKLANETYFDSSHHFKPILEGVKPLIQLVLLLAVACHVILGLH
ncbi:hypothetical protein CPB84DRAFT_1852813 [Gymnopilus junonius]|uniref:Uncharacterized protein n=1 Tax=Gymnopilus junonius TaxID=109634 RepID=A0A9P5NAH2_GYMJU|nr:hypothetical protein CPB84DRAFT_1852813 [Gymnopilus junonius]